MPSSPPAQPATRTVRHCFRAMGSPCELLLEGPEASQAAAERAVQEVRRIEARYSRYRPDSLISRINAAAGTGQVTAVDEETASLLDFAAALHASSGGLFDLSAGVLGRAWDFRSDQLPSQHTLDALLPLVGWDQVRWRDGGLSLPQAGMALDLGGIGKEYAADRAAGLLVAEGQAHGHVNLGGDIRVLGPRADGSAWHFGVQHPRRPEGVLASVRLRDGALATSGDYERFIERDGTRYCHILDPRTGWPCRGWQSVSVVAPACVAAGALSTVAMLMGPAAPDFLRGQGVAFLLVDAAGREQGSLDGAMG